MFRRLALVLVATGILLMNPIVQAQTDKSIRTWTDSTGKFTIVGSLIEVKGSDVLIKTADGKTMQIPLARLSKNDQDFLSTSDNPFEEIGDAPASTAAAMPSATPNAPAMTASGNSYDWAKDFDIDWSGVQEMDSGYGTSWTPKVAANNEFAVELKRATFQKKAHFFENMHEMMVNPICSKAAVGCTVSFSIPKPLSRVSIIDFATGKSQNSVQIEANMRPLAVLNDAVTLLMVGTDDERGSFEKSSELQLWKISGKKILRSKSWIPFPGTDKAHGVSRAIPLKGDLVALLATDGHLGVINVKNRAPVWHASLGGNGAIDVSTDGSLIAVLSGNNVSIVDAVNGTGHGSVSLGNDHIAWPKICWSPNGKSLMVSYTNTLRVLDIESGVWTKTITSPSGPISSNALDFPNDDYALLNKSLLMHLPSQIQVCQYLEAGQIKAVGGKTFVAMMNDQAGIVVPAVMPHPAAEKILEQAEKDPSVFLLHPGVEVSINAGAAGQYQSQALKGLTASAEKAGYKVVANAPIRVEASITGPTREAVSYIGRGSYTIDKYISTVKITWQGRDVWSTSGSNVQGLLVTKENQTFEEAVNETGKSPNLWIFDNTTFPKLLQKPKENQNNQQSTSALMTSRFTMQGLVDE